jgi:hypothetical protein
MEEAGDKVIEGDDLGPFRAWFPLTLEKDFQNGGGFNEVVVL